MCKVIDECINDETKSKILHDLHVYRGLLICHAVNSGLNDAWLI